MISVSINNMIKTLYANAALRHFIDRESMPAVLGRDRESLLRRMIIDSFFAVVGDLAPYIKDFGPDQTANEIESAMLDVLWLDLNYTAPAGAAATLANAILSRVLAAVYASEPAYSLTQRQLAVSAFEALKPPAPADPKPTGRCTLLHPWHL